MSTRRLKVKAMDAALLAGVKIDNVERFCRELGVSPRMGEAGLLRENLPSAVEELAWQRDERQRA
jgi:hypothetical protein